MKLNKTITVHCSAEELWDWLVTFEKNQKWNECLLESQKVSAGEIRKGYVSKILIREGRKKVWYEEEIMEYTPYSHLKIALKGGSLGKTPMMVGYKITPAGGSVTINYTNSWQPNGFMLKLLHKAITKASDTNAEKELMALKNHIENQR